MALCCSRSDRVFTRRTNPMQWAIVIAAFLASAVEFVEAFTLVLVAGITTNWRSAILGALGAAAVLAVIVATLGVALVTYVPIEVLRFVVGFLLLLFGLKWLKNAIQRYTGLKLIHDEQAAYEANLAEARARGEPAKSGLDTFGVVLSFSRCSWKGWKWPSSSFPLAAAERAALAARPWVQQ